MKHKTQKHNTNQITPQQTIAILQSAINLYFAGKYLDGLAAMESLLKAQPLNVDALNIAAACARSAGKVTEAEQFLATAIRVNPDYADAHNNLGSLLYSLNRFAEAEASFRRALALRPDYAEAYFNLALLHQDTNRFDEAELAYKRVIEIRPDYAEAYINLGNIFNSANRLTECESAYRSAVAARPNYAPAYNSLGLLLQQLKRFSEAEAVYQTALAVQADYAEAQCNLGNLLIELDRLPEAEASYRSAIERQPAHARAYWSLGNLLQCLQRLPEAEAAYRQALALQPDYADAYFNLGILLMTERRFPEAQAVYRHLLELIPNHAETLNNLGFILHELKRFAEAEVAYLQALAVRPDYSDAYNNLGRLLVDLKRPREAYAAYQQALAIQPGLAEAHNNLGMLLIESGQFQEAEAAFRAAVFCKPDYGHALGQLDHMQRYQCAWSSLEENELAITRLLDTGIATRIPPFILLAIPGASPLQQLQVAKLFAEKYVDAPLPIKTADLQAASKTRLRIGYLSADFHDHATAWLLAGVLERHHRESVSIYAYSYGPDSDAPIRQRLISACDCFRDIAPLSDIDAASQIARDEVDILVDLKGYTKHNRLGISALRPAPVIVSWLGYPGTLGDSRLADFLIGDPVVTPIAHASHFSETLALMPHCYQPTDRDRPVGRRPSRTEAGLPESGFVFCSFNQSYKFTPQIFSLWCRLLNEVPGSVFWLLKPDSNAVANLRMEAKARGIDPDRLIFAPMLPQTDHLGRLQLADLALDTFPCTSHTTGSDALWAGVPLITKIGETFASRVAASLLHAADLPELVAESDAAYFDLALSLAQQPEKLAVVRRKLYANRLNSNLFDTARFTRDLERLYYEIWVRQIAAEKTSFALSPSDCHA